MKTKEQQAAELLAKLNGMFEGDDGLPAIIERFKALEKTVKEFEGLDLKKCLEEVDKIKASQETIRNRIRNFKGGAYVPGLEDEGKDFSLIKALTGIRRGEGDWGNVGASKEKAILDACRQKAAQSIGDDSLGGYFVPDQVIPDVIAAIYTKSVFIALDGEGETVATVIGGLQGGNVRIPKFEGGTVAFWIGEEDAYTESLATVADISMNPKKLGVLVKLTDAMQRFGGFGFEALLRRDITKAAAKKLDLAILQGKGGDNEPRGLVNDPNVKIFSAQSGATVANNPTAITAANSGDWTGGEVTFDVLDNMDLVLEEDDVDFDSTFRTVAAPRYYKRLKQSKVDHYTSQTTNQAYLLGMPMLTDKKLQEVIDSFSKMNQISTVGKPGAIVGAPSASGTLKYSTVVRGNLGDVLIGRWGGIEIEDDRGLGTGFATDHTFIKLRMYADVAIRQPRHLIFSPDAKVRD